MIIGVGIDAVAIDRFSTWIEYPDAQLLRIISAQEIAYAKSCPRLAPERFAARFAAREALFKALAPHYPDLKFLTLCRATTISSTDANAPSAQINWQMIGIEQEYGIHISLTHTETTAMVVAIIEK